MKRWMWLLLVPLALLAAFLSSLWRAPKGAEVSSSRGPEERTEAQAQGSELTADPGKPPAPAPKAGGSPTRKQENRHVVIQAPWGGQVGALGRSQPSEAAAEGPKSFVVDGSGRLYVLDQVNGRISIFSPGRDPRVIPIPSNRFEDIDLDANGDLVLLDRVGDGAVALLDFSGRVKAEIALIGEGVTEAGGVTSLHARKDGVWVEYEHTDLVRVADASGAPDRSRPTQPGRPTTDGALALRAQLAPDRTKALVLAHSLLPPGDAASLLAEIAFGSPIATITALESDARGRVYLAAHLLRENEGAPGEIVDESHVLVVLDAGGAELGRIVLATPHGHLEQFRPIRIGPDGAVYHLYATDEGAFMEKVWL
jgi:hypothetical protein